jgi:nucleoside-diphosphate-sugar epimerase
MSNMSQSTYGMLKAIGEKFTHSANGKVVKFWNVYGHEKNEKKFHVISDFIKMAKESGEIRMRTNGHETRDFIYDDDCCAGHEAIKLNFNKFFKI